MEGEDFDQVQVAELFISGRVSVDNLKSLLGITKTQIKVAVRRHSNEAANRLVSAAYDSLEITDPFVFNREPEERPTGWTSKYTPSAVIKKGTKISMAMDIVQTHFDNGTLTRDNRDRIVKQIAKVLKLKNEQTAATYFADSRKLADLQYTG